MLAVCDSLEEPEKDTEPVEECVVDSLPVLETDTLADKELVGEFEKDDDPVEEGVVDSLLVLETDTLVVWDEEGETDTLVDLVSDEEPVDERVVD